MKNRIAIIVPYFGKSFPRYFQYFLESIRDKEFEIIFFTDLIKPNDLPQNITWVSITFISLRELISKKLEVKISSIIKPYKLCDFRPAFG